MSTYLFPVQDSSCQYLSVFTPDLKDGSVERLAILADQSLKQTSAVLKG
ncbi:MULTISPECIES: hypothetical protein [unclassified Paenibacillus]|nr:hypothetical protein [Paenibacillus sp. Y412MC10]